jgi:hypothetical protein
MYTLSAVHLARTGFRSRAFVQPHHPIVHEAVPRRRVHSFFFFYGETFV